ncbi:MAG: response regulator [Caulobacteraceae bacterium]|nr:response regulator [Caulobacteraceae bacterium]
MIFGEEKLARQLAPFLQRVLVVDGSHAGARLLGELLKGVGAKHVYAEPTAAAAMAACKNFEPQVIFTELTGRDLDGLNLVRTLRRSTLSCRQTPVIVVTTEATAAAIVASRNAGVHEFLRKPFTTKDLVRRLEAVCLRSRDWIEAINYIGPDRRRFNSGDYQGPRKRQSDHPAMADAARIRQALIILKSAIKAIESDPAQALRSMQAQNGELRTVAASIKDPKLSAATAVFGRCLAAAAESGVLSRSDVEASSASLWGFMPADEDRAAAVA